ncbi:MAG: hypothetical protein KGL02_15135, partial [Acidobacteriota bacterium]|nr:hypothetical protein [Acidobacteriota bacterium]
STRLSTVAGELDGAFCFDRPCPAIVTDAIAAISEVTSTPPRRQIALRFISAPASAPDRPVSARSIWAFTGEVPLLGAFTHPT